MPRVIVGVLVAGAVVGCGSARVHRAQERCEGFVAELRGEAQQVQAPGLRFAAVQFAHAAIDPHGGPRPCWLAGLAPIGWSAATTPDADGLGAMWVIDAGRSHWRIGWVGGENSADAWPDFLARTELLRRRDGEVLRDESGIRSHVLVTREADGVHLLMLRWHPPQPGYVRCEARLADPYAAALPAFEAACATTLALWWEWSGR